MMIRSIQGGAGQGVLDQDLCLLLHAHSAHLRHHGDSPLELSQPLNIWSHLNEVLQNSLQIGR